MQWFFFFFFEEEINRKSNLKMHSFNSDNDGKGITKRTRWKNASSLSEMISPSFSFCILPLHHWLQLYIAGAWSWLDLVNVPLLLFVLASCTYEGKGCERMKKASHERENEGLSKIATRRPSRMKARVTQFTRVVVFSIPSFLADDTFAMKVVNYCFVVGERKRHPQWKKRWGRKEGNRNLWRWTF